MVRLRTLALLFMAGEEQEVATELVLSQIVTEAGAEVLGAVTGLVVVVVATARNAPDGVAAVVAQDGM